MKVVLTVVKGPEQGRSMEFTEPRGFLIGRARDADLRLPEDDPYVGRRHVFLEICPPRIRLQDLGSTNVAHVNGKPITEAELAHGDVIEIGYTQLQVWLSYEAAPQTYPCSDCGSAMEILPGETAPERCPACVEKRAHEQRRRGAPPKGIEAHCECGKDLSERANSDGRAAELEGAVIYSCERCAPGKAGGRSIGRYEFRRDLGAGGMGSVHLVYQRPTARLLALKLVKDLANRMLAKRFEREVRLQKTLIHPNVARYVDAGSDARGTPYLVTEFVPGGSLDAYVAAHGGRLERREALEITRGVLQGLALIHHYEIVHRDIKPANVLLTKANGSRSSRQVPRPKLADFGLAVCYARAGGTSLTRPGTAMGTLMFMPPEQIRDAKSVREPADVYAVGVMLYYLLTGKYTFDFPTPADVLRFQRQNQKRRAGAHLSELLHELMRIHEIRHPFHIILANEPIPIRRRDPSIPQGLAEVIDRAVRKPAKQRFRSAREFELALNEAAG